MHPKLFMLAIVLMSLPSCHSPVFKSRVLSDAEEKVKVLNRTDISHLPEGTTFRQLEKRWGKGGMLEGCLIYPTDQQGVVAAVFPVEDHRAMELEERVVGSIYLFTGERLRENLGLIWGTHDILADLAKSIENNQK